MIAACMTLQDPNLELGPQLPGIQEHIDYSREIIPEEKYDIPHHPIEYISPYA